MKVAADAKLRYLKFARSEDLRRSRDRVVRGLVEAVGVVRIRAELAGENLAVDRRFRGAGITCQPREVGEGKRFFGFGLVCGFRRRRGCRGLWIDRLRRSRLSRRDWHRSRAVGRLWRRTGSRLRERRAAHQEHRARDAYANLRNPQPSHDRLLNPFVARCSRDARAT